MLCRSRLRHVNLLQTGATLVMQDWSGWTGERASEVFVNSTIGTVSCYLKTYNVCCYFYQQCIFSNGFSSKKKTHWRCSSVNLTLDWSKWLRDGLEKKTRRSTIFSVYGVGGVHHVFALSVRKAKLKKGIKITTANQRPCWALRACQGFWRCNWLRMWRHVITHCAPIPLPLTHGAACFVLKI